MPVAWPERLQPIRVAPPHLTGMSRGGGRPMSGREQVVATPGGGGWAFSLTLPIRGRADELALRGLLLALDGRAGTVLAPIFDGRQAPWFVDPLTGGFITPARAAESAVVNPAYLTHPDTSALLSYQTTAAAALNATVLQVARGRGGLLQPGMLFGLPGGRLHGIAGMATDPGGPGPFALTIRPWLRAPVAAGTLLEFGRPLLLARLASDDEGRRELQDLRFGEVTLNLVEA